MRSLADWGIALTSRRPITLIPAGPRTITRPPEPSSRSARPTSSVVDPNWRHTLPRRSASSRGPTLTAGDQLVEPASQPDRRRHQHVHSSKRTPPTATYRSLAAAWRCGPVHFTPCRNRSRADPRRSWWAPWRSALGSAGTARSDVGSSVGRDVRHCGDICGDRRECSSVRQVTSALPWSTTWP